VEDEVDPAQHLEYAVGKLIDELGAMGVSDHPDARRQAGSGAGAVLCMGRLKDIWR
jgi:hypothetical protein